MLMPRRPQSGASLIELMIGLVILAIVLSFGVPVFGTWIANTRIRTAAEAIYNGIQLARAEAVRRNASVQVAFGAGASTWTVSLANTGEIVQERSAEEGSSNTAITFSPGGTSTLTFNALGRVAANLDGSPAITEVKIDSTSVPAADSRELCVMVSTAGVARLCDPQLATTDPRGCLPAVPAGCL